MLNVSNTLKSMYFSSTPTTFIVSAKLQILDKDYVVIGEYTDRIVSGRVTVDRSRTSIRNFEITLSNQDGLFTWGQNNLIWLDKKLKLFYGTTLPNGSIEYVPIGVFPCSAPKATSKPGIAEVTLSGSDKMQGLGKCPTNIVIQGGINSPSGALVLGSTPVSSSFGAGTYYVACDFTNSQGRTTLGGSLASISLTANQSIYTDVFLPSTAGKVGIYVGTTSNPLLLGTIDGLGNIVYSGSSITGLSVSVVGRALNITISGVAAANGAIPQTTNTAVGTDIATAIKSVLSGIETMFNLDDTSMQQRVPYDMTFHFGSDFSKIISDLAAVITWEIFYDANGYLRLRAPVDPNMTNPLLSFDSQQKNFNLWAGAERMLDDSLLANSISVYGGSTQFGIVSYILEDNSVDSPTSIQNIGRRVYAHNNGNLDPVIVTTDQAKFRAEYEYKKRVRIVEQLNFDMFPVPFLEQDDVIQITDPANGTSGNYQVISFTLPLGASNQMMSGTMWKNRSFTF